jgi:hypothetical protein
LGHDRAGPLTDRGPCAFHRPPPHTHLNVTLNTALEPQRIAYLCRASILHVGIWLNFDSPTLRC